MSKDKKNNAFVLWFTGLSGSGKTTLAKKIFISLKKQNRAVELLDGDNVRKILPNTGFSKQERMEHVCRMGYTTSLLEKNGIITIASFISPHRQARKFVRNLCSNFIEIYLNPPLETCINRDVKGLYKKACQGKLENFTGISDLYEKPLKPEIVIDTKKHTIKESCQKIITFLTQKGYLQ